MHDRTVNGETLVFGNQGALFMNAMSWWDHKTGSVWSQVWGQALDGPLRGTQLELLPSQPPPWATWVEQHPETLALQVDGLRLRRERFRSNYVIGVTLEDAATAFRYEVAAEEGVINDTVGQHPVVVHADPEARSVHVYLRQVDNHILTFVQDDEVTRDLETGSTWNMERGLGLKGPLQGQALRPVPYVPAFPDSWRDFYPRSRWYGEEKDGGEP